MSKFFKKSNCLTPSDVFVDNGDGTFTHTDANGNPVTYTSTQVVYNQDGTYTVNNADGSSFVITAGGGGAGNTSAVTKVTNADGTETVTHDDGTGTTEDFCVGAVLTDEDGRSTTLNCDESILHRTLHIDNLHGGSVGPTTIGVSHADSDQNSVTGITTQHVATAISGVNLTSGAKRTIAGGGTNLSTTGSDSVILAGRDSSITGSALGARSSSVIGSVGSNIDNAQYANITASDRSTVTGANSMAAATTLTSITSITSFAGGTLRGTISGNRSGMLASVDSTVTGSKSVSVADSESTISNDNSGSFASRGNTVTGSAAAVIGGGNGIVNSRDSVSVAHIRVLLDGNESAAIGGEDGVTTANAARSVIHGGQFLRADQFDQNIMGAFNDPYGSPTADRALIIGNGAAGALRNSHVLTRLGEHYMYNNPGAPSANIDPTMGRIYVQGGALVYEGTAGTITTLAPA